MRSQSKDGSDKILELVQKQPESGEPGMNATTNTSTQSEKDAK